MRRTRTLLTLTAIATLTVAIAAVPANAATARPVVTSLSTHYGGVAGGTSVTVHGTGFTRVSAVYFGNLKGTSVHVVSGRELTVRSPRQTGVHGVYVHAAAGTSAARSADVFTYVAAPTVTALSTHYGPLGGAAITIRGTGFTSVRSVTVGTASGRSVHVTSSTQLSVTLPAAAAGTHDVVVHTAFGTSRAGTADHVTYLRRPVLTEVSPQFGPRAGGGTLGVEIYGTDLAHATAVHFGTTAVTKLVIGDFLGLQAPAHTAGTVSVTVTTPGGTSAVGPGDNYTFTTPAPDTLHGGPDTLQGGQVLHPYRGELQGISCPASGGCVAIDSDAVYDQTGTSWGTPHSIRTSSVAALSSISCPTAGFCAALTRLGQVLIRTDGTWSGPVQPDPAGFVSISCPVAGTCVAVDGASAAAGYVLNNGTWSGPAKLGSRALSAISCATPTYCLAVGAGGTAWQYTGTWTNVSAAPNGDYQDAVSCSSPTFCMVGYDLQTVIWDGSSWSAPQPAFTTAPGFVEQLSCVGQTCVAGNGRQALASYSDDSWTVDTVTTDGGLITGVSCASSTDCAAVNTAGDLFQLTGSGWSSTAPAVPVTGMEQSLSCPTTTFCAMLDTNGNAYTGNGQTWGAPVTLDHVASFAGDLDCTAPTFCLAVSPDGTWATYDGTSWSTHPGAPARLARVSCASPTFCLAVGADGAGGRFTAAGWAALTIPGNASNDVSCASATYCVAVGAGKSVTYTGTGFGAVSTAVASDLTGYHDRVACPAPGMCVGAFSDDSVSVLRGASWGPSFEVIYGPTMVTCATTTSCAVANDGQVSEFDGAAWTDPLPSRPTMTWPTTAVSCAAAHACFVVGGGQLYRTGA